MEANNETRLDEIEEAFMLFAMMATGQPSDATDEEKIKADARFAEIMESVRGRFLKRIESKF